MDYDVLIFNIGVFIAAIFLLDYGADKFIDHTAVVASRLGVSQTLVALLTAGAEWEELAVVIAAVAQNQSALALGNVIGSVISNILAAFSLGLLFQRGPVDFDRSSKIYVALLLVLAPPVTVLGYFGKGGVVFGSILIGVFVLYVASIGAAIVKGALAAPEREDSSDDDNDNDDGDSDGDGESGRDENGRGAGHAGGTSGGTDPPSEHASSPLLPSTATRRRRPPPLRNHVFQIVLGFLALSLSGYVLSHSATSIAVELNISGTVYGITVLAFATTLPEKFIAVVGASRGHSGIVVANTAGSNVFLLTLCLGVVYVGGGEAGTIHPFELGVALASVVAFAAIVFFGARRWMGVVLLLGYLAFLVLELTVFRR